MTCFRRKPEESVFPASTSSYRKDEKNMATHPFSAPPGQIILLFCRLSILLSCYLPPLSLSLIFLYLLPSGVACATLWVKLSRAIGRAEFRGDAPIGDIWQAAGRQRRIGLLMSELPVHPIWGRRLR